MAQKTEQEETEFKVPETLTLCANNCGFAGNPATDNLCQNCFNAAAGIHKPPAPPQKFACSASVPADRSDPAVPGDALAPEEESGGDPAEDLDPPSTAARTEVNRCSGCRRKVGLTGFRCRCGELFCAKHRYSDRHDCSYDYKSAGREAIARENPVVRAAKIVRV